MIFSLLRNKFVLFAVFALVTILLCFYSLKSETVIYRVYSGDIYTSNVFRKFVAENYPDVITAKNVEVFSFFIEFDSEYKNHKSRIKEIINDFSPKYREIVNEAKTELKYLESIDKSEIDMMPPDKLKEYRANLKRATHIANRAAPLGYERLQNVRREVSFFKSKLAYLYILAVVFIVIQIMSKKEDD